MANETEFDQADRQSNQPDSNAGEQSQTDSQLFEVNGQQLTAQQVVDNYKNLQADYTKKTQELSQFKSSATQGEPTVDDTEQWTTALKSLGFTHKDDLEAMNQAKVKKELQAKELDQLIESNINLAPFKSAMEAIGKTDNSSWSDIATKYGFIHTDKLSKAKSSEPMGNPIPKIRVADKSLKDMTPTEYEEWRKSNLKGMQWNK